MLRFCRYSCPITCLSRRRLSQVLALPSMHSVVFPWSLGIRPGGMRSLVRSRSGGISVAWRGPAGKDAVSFASHELITEFVKDDDCFDAYYDRYAPSHSTKVGGWPSYMQGAPSQMGSFAFQIDSEEKPAWMLGDNGTMYFFRQNDEWSLHWDCY